MVHWRRGLVGGGRGLLLLLLLVAAASGQPRTRVEEIESRRDQKEQELTPEVPSKLEERLIWIKDTKLIERFSAGVYGFRALMGGAATGQGFAIGPEYVRRDLFRTKAVILGNYQITTSGSTRSEISLYAPEFLHPRLEAEIGAHRHNYNRIDYYGPGPDSEPTGRSNYRYEDMSFDTGLRVRLGRNFYLGSTIGGTMVNVGPGKNDDVISTELQYTPEQAPGIDRQTDFFRAGAYAGFDWRDSLAGARSGGVYGVIYDNYQDTDLNRHDFHLLKVRAEQYIPFFNRRRVVALRANSTFTWRRHDQTVPFYFQPVLGGSEDLRGYRPYRFYGDNSMIMNAEYRWEVFAGMDAAVFADAGKVFMDKSQYNFKNLESTVGFGIRFNVRNATFLRLDVGFSHEGVMFWVKFNDVFVKKPVGRTSPEHIF